MICLPLNYNTVLSKDLRWCRQWPAIAVPLHQELRFHGGVRVSYFQCMLEKPCRLLLLSVPVLPLRGLAGLQEDSLKVPREVGPLPAGDLPPGESFAGADAESKSLICFDSFFPPAKEQWIASVTEFTSNDWEPTIESAHWWFRFNMLCFS